MDGVLLGSEWVRPESTPLDVPGFAEQDTIVAVREQEQERLDTQEALLRQIASSLTTRPEPAPLVLPAAPVPTLDLSGLDAAFLRALETLPKTPDTTAELAALAKVLDRLDRRVMAGAASGPGGGVSNSLLEQIRDGHPLGQLADANNTGLLSSATGAAGFAGNWTRTRSVGIVAELTVVDGKNTTAPGGTFTFSYGEDNGSGGVTTTIDETRTIATLNAVRDFPLKNAGEWYKITFTPSRALVGAEQIVVATTLSRQYDGPFAHLANQVLEEANSTFETKQSFLKVWSLTGGTSENLRGDGTGRLLTAPTKGTYGGQAGISGTVNVPSGAVVRAYACQSGSVQATVTVPGISGSVIVPGSNQASTQFSDTPDPGTMVGPVTFVFSASASYTVTWVL